MIYNLMDTELYSFHFFFLRLLVDEIQGVEPLKNINNFSLTVLYSWCYILFKFWAKPLLRLLIANISRMFFFCVAPLTERAKKSVKTTRICWKLLLSLQNSRSLEGKIAKIKLTWRKHVSGNWTCFAVLYTPLLYVHKVVNQYTNVYW